jgi:hypothetical protein
MKAAPRFELGVRVLQTLALPLGDAAALPSYHSTKVRSNCDVEISYLRPYPIAHLDGLVDLVTWCQTADRPHPLNQG